MSLNKIKGQKKKECLDHQFIDVNIFDILSCFQKTITGRLSEVDKRQGKSFMPSQTKNAIFKIALLESRKSFIFVR